MFRNRKLWAVVILSVLVQSGVVFGRMSDERLREMQERAEKEGWPFTVGRNAATERSWDVLGGLLLPDPNDPLFRAKLDELEQREKMGVMEDLPDKLDYRDLEGVSIVPPIRDQTPWCGSCWAHSAVGVVESAILLDMYRRELNFNADEMDLSEQWLVSCFASCGGGVVNAAFDAMRWDSYMTRDGCGDEGAVLEEDFPYIARDDIPCDCPYRHPYGIESHHWAGFGEFGLKQSIYYHGPISVSVNVYDTFIAYNGGIYSENDGEERFAHAVILVGWDDHPPEQPEGPGVWILRNSWGTDWGEEGYMRIEYGVFNSSQLDLYGWNRYVNYVWDKDSFEAHWKFDEGEGLIAYDSVGDNDGDLIGNPQWVDGKIDGALGFDGDDYVELPEAVIIRDEYAKSICAWVYVGFWNDYATILRWCDERYPDPVFYNLTMAGFYTDGRLGAVLDSRGYNPIYSATKYHPAPVTVDAVCPTFEWHHVCYTYDGVTTSIYVDGNKQATEEVWDWSYPSQAEEAYIGRDSFDGIIDDVRVYNYALDIFEIWDLTFYDTSKLFSIKNSSGVPVTWFDNLGNLFLKGSLAKQIDATGELVGHWKFDDGSGDIAEDSAGDNNGRLGAEVGEDPRDPAWVEGKINGALDFDVDSGEEDYVSLPAIGALATDNVTISAWIKGDSIGTVSGSHPIVSTYKYEFDDPYYYNYGYYLYVARNRPVFYLASAVSS